MSLLINPSYLPYLDLVADTATWDALKLLITDWIDANAGATISDADVVTMRALDADFSDDKIWAQITEDLDLHGAL